MVLLLILLGCAGRLREGDAPDDMSAAAHRERSTEHFRKSREHRSQYDPEREVSDHRSERGIERYSDDAWGRYEYGDLYWDARQYDPGLGHLEEADEHERKGAAHLAAARSLERFEERECKAFPARTRVSCPLLGSVEAVEDVPDGVRVRFAEGVNLNAAIAHIRCHVAFARARARARAGMEGCPLYLEGVAARRVGRSRSIELFANPDDIDELRRRTRAHLGSL